MRTAFPIILNNNWILAVQHTIRVPVFFAKGATRANLRR
jgi:hypothetical protein